MRKILMMLLAILISGLCSMMGQRIHVVRPQYHAVYDTQLLSPAQVEWKVTASQLGAVKRMPGWLFRSDINDSQAVATHDDFTNSGYHRGHLCPAADWSCCPDDMRATFSVANVCPQIPSLNVGRWKATETAVRSAALLGDTIAVVVLPIFLHRDTLRIGAHGVAVPHAFFKAAWVVGNDSIIGSWFFFNHL